MDTGEQVIRVLIADNHNVVRRGLVALLDEVPEVLVVGEVCDGVQTVELAQRTQPTPTQQAAARMIQLNLANTVGSR